MKNAISRRSFLKGMAAMGALGAVSALSGCSVSTSTGEASSAGAASSGAASSGAASSGAAASSDEVNIKWMFWDDLEATEDLISLGYADVLKRFNEADNGYHVEAITTNLEEYDSKLNALVAAGQTPDLFTCNPGPNLSVYVNAGVAMDLTDLLTNQQADWYSSFTTGIFDKVNYDGKIMAVPTNFAAACVFYNTEIFDACGVTPPTTFDELLTVCQTIQDKGYAPISCSAGTPWCLSMVAGYLCERNGVDITAIESQSAKWTDDNCIAAGNNLAALSKFFQPTAVGDSNDEATAHFYNGEAAMLIQGSWAIAQINGSMPDFEEKCGVFAFPKVSDSVGEEHSTSIIVKTDNLVVSATTEHLDAVVELMKCFTDTTAQAYTAEVAGKIPVTTGVEVDYSKAPKQLEYVQDVLAQAKGTLGFYNESLTSVEAGDIFDDNMVSLFLGDETPEQAFGAIQQWYEEEVF